MLDKIWKLLCIFLLIIACLFNLIIKLVNINSFDRSIQGTVKTKININGKEEVKNE